MKKTGMLVILALSLLLMGCWPIVGAEKTYVKEIAESGLFNTAFFVVIVLVVINLIIRAIKTGKKNLLIGIVTIIVGIGFSYTILGTVNYWIFNAVIGWGQFGIFIWVFLSMAQGYAPGFYGVIPVGLYFAYHDPRLLMYYAIPALAVDLLEAIIRKKPKA